MGCDHDPIPTHIQKRERRVRSRPQRLQSWPGPSRAASVSSKPPLHRRIESVDGVCRRVSRSKRSHPPRGAPRRVRELDRTCAGARATPPGPAPGGAGSVVVRASLARRARAYCHSASCSDFALSNRGMINHVSRRTAATPASARLRRGSGARRSVPLPPRCDGGGSRRRRFSQPRLKLL